MYAMLSFIKEESKIAFMNMLMFLLKESILVKY